MAKVTACDGCPETMFDPASVEPGTLMLYKGALCMRTTGSWDGYHAAVMLEKEAPLRPGELIYIRGFEENFAPAPGKYLLENER